MKRHHHKPKSNGWHRGDLDPSTLILWRRGEAVADVSPHLIGRRGARRGWRVLLWGSEPREGWRRTRWAAKLLAEVSLAAPRTLRAEPPVAMLARCS